MPESISEPTVIISAQAHQHPAVRKLARACISLAALQQVAGPAEDAPQPDLDPPAQPTAAAEERRDG